MAIARLSVILALILHLSQNCVNGQQNGLENASNQNQGLINHPAISSDPKILDLIASVKNNPNLKPSGNGPNPNTIPQQCNKQLPQISLQQLLSLQQQKQAANSLPNSQPLTINLEPIQGTQILPQTLNNQELLNSRACANQNSQQPINLQPINPLQCTNQNLQKKCVNSQQNSQTPGLKLQLLNLQQLTPQQTQSSIPLNNFQITGQQPTLAEISLSSLPTINGHVQDLPSQVSQGIYLSNLGLNSALSSAVPTACSNLPPDQVSIINTQNGLPISSVPIALLDGSQNANILPTKITPSYYPVECAGNNPPQPATITPACSQSPIAGQQNQQIQSANAVQYLPTPAQAPLQMPAIQTRPIQFESVQAPHVQTQSIPTQRIQTQPDYLVQNEPAPNPQNQPSLTALLLSQLQPTNSNQQNQDPSNPNLQFQNPSNYPMNSNYGSKSSSMKALLPLLFNLLKEKNGCGCQPNCNNCGYMNNMNNLPEQLRTPCMNNNNNYCSNIQEEHRNDINENYNVNQPQVIDGYSKQRKNGKIKGKDEADNYIGSEELEIPKKAQDKKIYKNSKKRKYESIEYDDDDDDYGDSYENED